MTDKGNWNRRTSNPHRDNSRSPRHSGASSGQRTMRRSRGAMSNGRRGDGNSFTKRATNNTNRR